MQEFSAEVRTLAIDLAKNVFQLAGEDRLAQVMFEERLKSREALQERIKTLPSSIEVLMETGPGAQSWARLLLARGVKVRVLPAQRVAEHRSGAKNDRNDVLAILRAGRDESIHAVPVKSVERLTMQAMHRVRSGYLSRRTSIGNQVRGLLTEHGIVFKTSNKALEDGLCGVLGDASVPIPDRLRDLIADLWAEWKHLEHRIATLDGELGRVAKRDPVTAQVMSIPGVGPMIATALICKDINPDRFANARQFAAYFGLVPDQHSSGNKVRLKGMSKRGDSYIRNLLINGAHAVVRRVGLDDTDPHRRRILRWKQRHGANGAAVRVANHNLRVIFALVRDGGVYRQASADNDTAEEWVSDDVTYAPAPPTPEPSATATTQASETASCASPPPGRTRSARPNAASCRTRPRISVPPDERRQGSATPGCARP